MKIEIFGQKLIELPDDHPKGIVFKKVQWFKGFSLPFLATNLIGLAVILLFIFTDYISWKCLMWAGIMYYVRMFFVTGFLHRYFSHRSYKFRYSKKFFEFLASLCCITAVQGGTLWWAGQHRLHHKNSDRPSDEHSVLFPHIQSAWKPTVGIWSRLRKVFLHFTWSHFLWFMTQDINRAKEIPNDFKDNGPLAFLEKPVVYISIVVLFASSFFFIGGIQGLLAFFLSTSLLYQGTFCINSLAHLWGKRINADDHSRNNLLLSLVTLGEGWHSDHHQDPNRVWQGQHRWKYLTDITGIILWCGQFFGIGPIKFGQESSRTEAKKIFANIPEVPRARKTVLAKPNPTARRPHRTSSFFNFGGI